MWASMERGRGRERCEKGGKLGTVLFLKHFRPFAEMGFILSFLLFSSLFWLFSFPSLPEAKLHRTDRYLLKSPH